MKRVHFGSIHADSVTQQEAIDRIVDLVRRREGGFVVTPNVDHVVLAEENAALRAAYTDASLSLVDGMPLVWLSRVYGHALPEKISGSDLVEPLVGRAAREDMRVFLLGGAPGIGERAAAIWTQRFPSLKIAGTYAPPLGFERDEKENARTIERVRAANPDLVLVALGCPKQELWMHAHEQALAPAVCLGIGASLDFVAGVVKRAPTIVSRLGLEWAYRLAQEPRRLYHRYLVRDRAILGIAWRTFRRPAKERVSEVTQERAPSRDRTSSLG